MLPYLLAFAVTTSLRALAAPTLGVKIVDGRTELAANWFGLPASDAEYEYVVVGGGNAGSTIASRLAMAGHSVALVEAGSFYEIYNSNLTVVPGYNFNYNTRGDLSQVLWNLPTEPQVGLNGRSINYTVGRTFGGSTASNYMGYHRGTSGSFGVWAEELQDDSWNWDGVLPYYQKSVNFTPPNFEKINAEYDIPYDGDNFVPGGPVQVSYGNYQAAYFTEINQAFENLNFTRLDGLDGGELIGYAPCKATIDPEAATRSTSETAYLQNAMQNTTIKVYPSTLGERVVFDENGRATGVVVRSTLAQPASFTLNATKEVIISAGALHSPQLLLLSGIGPRETLEQHNISVVAELPGVGQNLWDQPYVGLTYKINRETNTQIALENPDYAGPAVEEYLSSQGGPLSGLGGAEALGWEKFPNRTAFSESTISFLSTFPADWPEAEYIPLAVSPTPDDIGPNDQYFSLGVCLTATAARGNLTIRSTDPTDNPVVNPNWLGDDGDVEQALQGFYRTREIAAASGLVIEEYIPGEELQAEDEIVEWIRDNGSLIYHASCTCAMGSDDNPMAVLDARARVRGVTGLRVVDASSFPSLPPGHPQSTVYMLAEKIADYIINGQ